jgi:hypothetical protein
MPDHPWWHLSVGLCIAFAGCLGVIVPFIRDLSKIRKLEKAIWVVVVVALTFLELRMITWSDQDAEKNRHYAQCLELQQFQAVLDTENTNFNATATGLEQSYTQSRKQFSTTMGGISKEIDTFTGGHSYLVFFYTPDQGFLMFSQKGDYSVFDAQARIVDLDKPFPAVGLPGTTVDVGEVTKARAAIFSVPPTLNESGNEVNFSIIFTSRNGGWTELFRARRLKNGWAHAIRVQGAFSDLKKSIVSCESITPGFPLDKEFNSLPINPKLPPCWP